MHVLLRTEHRDETGKHPGKFTNGMPKGNNGLVAVTVARLPSTANLETTLRLGIPLRGWMAFFLYAAVMEWFRWMVSREAERCR